MVLLHNQSKQLYEINILKVAVIICHEYGRNYEENITRSFKHVSQLFNHPSLNRLTPCYDEKAFMKPCLFRDQIYGQGSFPNADSRDRH